LQSPRNENVRILVDVDEFENLSGVSADESLSADSNELDSHGDERNSIVSVQSGSVKD